MLEINKLAIKFNGNTIIDKFDLSLKKGEIFALLGKSGCGKSSILRFIAGLEEAQKGEIVLENIKITSNGRHNVMPEKRQIGMLFQDYSLFPHMNVLQNITFGINHLSKNEKKDKVKYLLDLISLIGIEDKYPHQLSGGEQQRVSLARTLAPSPKLLLLDEPFSSIDENTNQNIIKQLKSIIKKSYITTIIVTHNKDEVKKLSDRVGDIKNKRLNYIN